MSNISKIGSNSKKEISKVFAKLRDYGYLVFNFNSNRKLNRGKMTGFCDHLIIGFGSVIFVEVKLDNDFMKPDQIKLMNTISTIKKYVSYVVIRDLKSANELQEQILKYRG